MQTSSSVLNYITSGKILKDKNFLIAAATAVSTVLIYGLYRKLSNRKKSEGETKIPPICENQSSEDKAREYIKMELKRLQNPKLT